jgi:acyl homoserine lactone synthase
MIEIIQAGQADKARLLIDMHHLRRRVFKERMRWNVTVTDEGLEVDQFDIPEAVYLLALDDDRRVIGHWRLLPTNGPCMIREIWPQFLDTMPLPPDPLVWEATRFCVDSLKANADEGLAQVSRATQEMFCGLIEMCMLCGITSIVSMYDMRMERLMRRIDCRPAEISARHRISGALAEVGRFVTNEALLTRVRTATGVQPNLVAAENLPPILQSYVQSSRLAQASSHDQSH